MIVNVADIWWQITGTASELSSGYVEFIVICRWKRRL
jgi:hypothetical protein